MKIITEFCPGTEESKAARKRANIDCNVCPKCGEAKSAIYYLEKKNISDRGIIESITEEWDDKKSTNKNTRRDVYQCLTCGACWWSELYEWEPLE